MVTATLESALWVGALASVGQRRRPHLEAELGDLMIQLLKRYKPIARA